MTADAHLGVAPMPPVRRTLKEWHIRFLQQFHMSRLRSGRRKRNVIYLCPGHDAANGGVMSIVSQADESAKLLSDADVFVCVMPGDPPLLRFTAFRNTRTLLEMRSLLSRLPDDGEVLIHIPEAFVGQFLQDGIPLLHRRRGRSFRFNILLQNIDLCPTREQVAALGALGQVTATTAHEAYSNTATANRIGCPVHGVSTWVSPGRFERVPFQGKRNLIVASFDPHPKRDSILAAIRTELPDFELIVIRNMTYERYREAIRQARFSLTFGEGLDGYFVETVFSGGIGFAVYNDRFFTPAFRQLPGVFASWEELASRLASEVRTLTDATRYRQVHETQYALLADLYQHERYVRNLSDFYARYFQASP